MPLLKEVPREVKEGKKREKEWVRQLWVKKNWMWFVPACVGAIVALVLLIIGIVSFIQRRYTVRILRKCVGSEVSTGMTELVVPDGKCGSPRVLHFGSFKKLRRLSIGDYCFRNARKVKFGGLKSLESISIGDESFYYASLELKSILIHIE